MDHTNTYDSDEELYFSYMLKELEGEGIILEWTYHPKPFELSPRVTHTCLESMKTKSKEVEKFLMHPHSYQADFLIQWNPGYEGRIFMTLDSLLGLNYPFIANMGKSGNPYSVIDVKGTFVGRSNDSGVRFPVDQKWVYARYQIYVQKIIPMHIFKETFTPAKFLITNKSGKARKLDYKPVSIKQYLQSITL